MDLFRLTRTRPSREVKEASRLGVERGPLPRGTGARAMGAEAQDGPCLGFQWFSPQIRLDLGTGDEASVDALVSGFGLEVSEAERFVRETRLFGECSAPLCGPRLGLGDEAMLRDRSGRWIAQLKAAEARRLEQRRAVRRHGAWWRADRRLLPLFRAFEALDSLVFAGPYSSRVERPPPRGFRLCARLAAWLHPQNAADLEALQRAFGIGAPTRLSGPRVESARRSAAWRRPSEGQRRGGRVKGAAPHATLVVPKSAVPAPMGPRWCFHCSRTDALVWGFEGVPPSLNERSFTLVGDRAVTPEAFEACSLDLFPSVACG